MLPGRQRAALLGREVLGLSAAETAELLGTTVAGGQQRPAAGPGDDAQHLPPAPQRLVRPAPDADERRLLDAFIDAHERCDAAAALAVAASDIRVTMPP